MTLTEIVLKQSTDARRALELEIAAVRVRIVRSLANAPDTSWADDLEDA